MMWKLTSAEPLNETLSKDRVAETIEELWCIPTSSRFNLNKPYWSDEDDEPTVMFASLPMLVFFTAPVESMNESSIVFSTKPKSSKLNVNCPYPSTSDTECPGKWKYPEFHVPIVPAESIALIL